MPILLLRPSHLPFVMLTHFRVVHQKKMGSSDCLRALKIKVLLEKADMLKSEFMIEIRILKLNYTEIKFLS